MSDTPRTDRVIKNCNGWHHVPIEHARELERELNAAKARVAELEARCNRLEEALENVINSGKPNQVDHPSMWKAWLKARLVMQAKEAKQ